MRAACDGGDLVKGVTGRLKTRLLVSDSIREKTIEELGVRFDTHIVGQQASLALGYLIAQTLQ